MERSTPALWTGVVRGMELKPEDVVHHIVATRHVLDQRGCWGECFLNDAEGEPYPRPDSWVSYRLWPDLQTRIQSVFGYILRLLKHTISTAQKPSWL